MCAPIGAAQQLGSDDSIEKKLSWDGETPLVAAFASDERPTLTSFGDCF